MSEWMVVPNFKRQVSTDEFYVSAMCFKDGIQWIFRANIRSGDSDSFRATCPCCGGDCIAFGNKNSISSSDEIEVVGWLVDRKEELLLVGLESTYSTVEDVLHRIIETHDFSASYQTIKLIQSGVNFHRKRLRPTKKSLTSGTLLVQFSTSEIEKPSNVKSDTSKRQKRNESRLKNAKKSMEEEKKNSLKRLRKSTQSSAKELLKKLRSVAKEEKSAQNPRKLRKSFEAFQIGNWTREHTKSQVNSCEPVTASIPKSKMITRPSYMRFSRQTSQPKDKEPKLSKSNRKQES